MTYPKILPHPLTLLSGILIFLSFPPFDQTYLIFVALIPWLYALDQAKTYKTELKEAFGLSLIMTLGGFYWVAYTLMEFASLPLFVAYLGLFLFGIICQPQYYLFALLRNRVFSNSILYLRPLLFSLLYTGIDGLLPKLFHDTLGHCFYHWPALRQLADIGGVGLLTFLILLTNETLYQTLLSIKKRAEPSLWPALTYHKWNLGLLTLAISASCFYGKSRLSDVQIKMKSKIQEIPMAIIQANIGDFDKIAAETGVKGATSKILDTYYKFSRLALEHAPKPEIIIWPETSYPSTFRTPETAKELERDQEIEAFVKSNQSYLFFGGYERARGKDFNAFFFLSPKNNLNESDLLTYRKNILLLFGETIPGADSFPFIRALFPQVGQFGRGEGPVAFNIPRLSNPEKSFNISPLICYEVLVCPYVLDSVNKGAQILLNITNDSWFGPNGEPYLHFALSTFRSIETRKPFVRATNTGISALVLPDGSIEARSKLFEPEIVKLSVPIYEPIETLILKFGEWFWKFCLGTSLVLILLLRIQRQRS